MNNNQPNNPNNITKNKTNKTAPLITMSKSNTTMNSKANTINTGWTTQANKRLHSNSSSSLSEPSSPNMNMDINVKKKKQIKKKSLLHATGSN